MYIARFNTKSETAPDYDHLEFLILFQVSLKSQLSACISIVIHSTVSVGLKIC